MRRIKGQGTPILTVVGTGCLVIAMLALSVLSIVQFRRNLMKTLTDMTKQNLERCTEQSVILFNNMVEDYFKQLEIIAQFCSVNTGVNDPEIIHLLTESNLDNPNIHYGISGVNGAFYSGSTVVKHITGQDYFNEALQGKRTVSEVLTGIDGRDSIVLAVPIWSEGKVAGVAVAEYNVQYFTNLLGRSQFAGFGATMVMQEDGKMLSSYLGMEQFDTLYEALETQMEFHGNDTLEHLQQQITQGESGLFTYYRDNKERYIYFKPTGIKDYTMISLVMAEAVDQDAQKISGQSMQFAIKNVVLYTLVLLLVWVMILFLRGAMRHSQIDLLTGAYSKSSVQTLIEKCMRGAGKNKIHALLFLDIDNFKTVNDTFGHKVGDQLLSSFTQVIRENIRITDIVGRFGGDEFVVFLQNVPSPKVARYKAQGLCLLLKNVCGYPVSASIGIACYPLDGTTYPILAQHADEALYRAKEAGKNQCFLYHSDLEREKEPDNNTN